MIQEGGGVDDRHSQKASLLFFCQQSHHTFSPIREFQFICYCEGLQQKAARCFLGFCTRVWMPYVQGCIVMLSGLVHEPIILIGSTLDKHQTPIDGSIASRTHH